MAVFDESKVINALHMDKAEIGKKYFESRRINALKRRVLNGTKNDTVVLTRVDKHCRDSPYLMEECYPTRYLYPYEEPEKKLVPYTWEDRERLRGKWVKHKDEDSTEFLIIWFDKNRKGELFIGIDDEPDGVKADELLENYTFLDGSPCGKEVEE